MMGFYPDCPGSGNYVLTTPVFDKITIKLSPTYYQNHTLTIKKQKQSSDHVYIDRMMLDNKPLNRYILSHKDLTAAKTLTFITK